MGEEPTLGTWTIHFKAGDIKETASFEVTRLTKICLNLKKIISVIGICAQSIQDSVAEKNAEFPR